MRRATKEQVERGYFTTQDLFDLGWVEEEANLIAYQLLDPEVPDQYRITKTGMPARKPGRNSIRGNQRTLAKAKKKEAVKKRRRTMQAQAERSKKAAKILVNAAKEKKSSKTGNIVDPAVVENLQTTALREYEEKFKDENVVFSPNPGPQMDFLSAPEKDVLYGGAAGGGKSYAMLVDPLRFAHRSAHRALILRRSMPELRELIDKSRELYPQAFPGARFREADKIWVFPSGAKLEFSFLERDSDVYKYQGQAYSWIGFDEITHMSTEFAWNYLASRLRTTDPEITTYMRCTANPGGSGAHWVKKRYIDPAPPNTSFKDNHGVTRKFIPARLDDNPYLSGTDYKIMLESLPEVQRKQLLEGNWDVNEDAAFPEFSVDRHVIEPFEIPRQWNRVKGIDYGYASESAVVWAAIDPDDDTIIVYRELYKKQLTGEDLAALITEYESEDPYSVSGVLDTAAWNRTGYTGPTIGETLVRAGHKLKPADKNRLAGKVQIHERLRIAHSGRPKMQIFSTCPNLIRELQSLPADKTRPEDVDTKAQDHAYDALRYLIMSRPRSSSPFEQMFEFKKSLSYEAADSEFGY